MLVSDAGTFGRGARVLGPAAGTLGRGAGSLGSAAGTLGRGAGSLGSAAGTLGQGAGPLRWGAGMLGRDAVAPGRTPERRRGNASPFPWRCRQIFFSSSIPYGCVPVSRAPIAGSPRTAGFDLTGAPNRGP